MKEIISRIKSSNLDNELTYYLVILLAFFIPISQYISTRLLVGSSIVALFFIIRNRHYHWIKSSWDIIIYLAVITIGLLYSDNVGLGMQVLETNFSWLALPVLLNSVSINRHKVYRIFYAFALGLIVSSIACLSFSTITFLNEGDVQSFFYYQLTESIGFQPTYLAYYLIFALTLVLYSAFYNLVTQRLVIIICVTLFYFLILLLTSSQTSFISLLFILSFFMLKFFLEPRAKGKMVVFGIACALLVAIFIFNSQVSSGEIQFKSDYWERSTLWQAALAANPDIILGVGTGDYKNVLNNYYLSQGLAEFAQESYNAHNQFIQIFFSNGLLGLLAIILLITRPIYNSIRNQNALGVLIFFPFILYGVTEVFLGRYQGVVFFALLHQSFSTYYHTIDRRVLQLMRK